MEWILLILIENNSGGNWAAGKAMTTISGYQSKASCEEAGKRVKWVADRKEEIKITCIPRPKQ